MGILRFLRAVKGPQKMQAAVVSVNTVNLEKLVEVYGPEEILPDYTETLNRISGDLKSVGARVAGAQGRVVVFLFPADDKGRYAEVACLAAFSIKRRLDELNDENGRIGIVELKSVIGIDAGEVTFEKDMATGPAVDMASFVMATADAAVDEVVVSQSVFNLLDRDKAYLKVKDMEVTGPNGPLPVYSLLHISA